MFCDALQEIKLHYPKQHPTMSSKRSRVARSSSLGEIGLSNHIIPIESHAIHWEKKRAAAAPVAASKPVQRPVKNSKLTMKTPELCRRSILTLGSPTRDSGNLRSEMKVDERFGMFLRACGSCKKTINQNDDVFMYGYLGAFCSPECRDKQISLDEKQNKTSWASIKVAENLVRKDMARRGFGAKVEKKYSVAKFK